MSGCRKGNDRGEYLQYWGYYPPFCTAAATERARSSTFLDISFLPNIAVTSISVPSFLPSIHLYSMVVLEAAAIGAAGYGVYRGGDAAVRKGKDAHKEWQRESVRRSQRQDLQARNQSRRQRIAELVQAKANGAASVATAAAAASNGARSFEDRHAAVLAKLRPGSRAGDEPPPQKNGPGVKLAGLLGRRK